MSATTARRVAKLAAVVCAALGLALPAVAAESYKVRLTPVPIDTATRAATTGMGSATAVLDGNTLTIEGKFEGLTSPATVARLHAGPVTGVRGPSFADVRVPAAVSGTFRAEIALPPGQADNLRAGRVYLQIHSESAPDGNLWGWLLE